MELIVKFAGLAALVGVFGIVIWNAVKVQAREVAPDLAAKVDAFGDKLEALRDEIVAKIKQ